MLINIPFIYIYIVLLASFDYKKKYICNNSSLLSTLTYYLVDYTVHSFETYLLKICFHIQKMLVLSSNEVGSHIIKILFYILMLENTNNFQKGKKKKKNQIVMILSITFLYDYLF